MTQNNMKNIQPYLDDFQQLSTQCKPDWFSSQRQSAFEYFKKTGFPRTRQENWKYTDTRVLAKKTFSNINGDRVAISDDELNRIRFENLDCYELVFINGTFSEACSNLDGLPDEVVIEDLATALIKGDALMTQHLSRYANVKTSPFTALNTAFIQQGCYINVPENTIIEKPINILYLSKSEEQTRALHHRNLIIMGARSEATVIENYIGLDDASYFTNTVTEAFLSTASILTHSKIQQESLNAYHIGNLHVMHDEASRLESNSISLGGALIRNDIHSELTAEGAEIIMNGLYISSDKQHVDNHTRVDHLKPKTYSTENYRGILNDKSRAVFNGKVVVHPQAQKIEAHQNNANLLLSDDAEIDTKPELEIYADDVKCSHGATVGQLDENMLFYLRSRAIDETTARSLLTYAFADEIIANISFAPIRDKLKYLIVGQLPEADLIREFTHE